MNYFFQKNFEKLVGEGCGRISCVYFEELELFRIQGG